jgi:hypothetical protein
MYRCNDWREMDPFLHDTILPLEERIVNTREEVERDADNMISVNAIGQIS